MNLGLSVQFRCSVVQNGIIVREYPPQKNLILDTGLNEAATRDFWLCFAACAIGTGTNPVRRDSGNITFSRSGNTVTASQAFFESGDVGRILKWDSGTEAYITQFNSSTEVLTSSTGTVAAAEGTIYYVNRTQLQTQTKRTSTTISDSGASGNTWNGTTGVFEMWRTFQHSAETSPVTIREVGWSWGASTENLFGMELLAGGGVSLATGQQLRVEVRLRVTLAPLDSQSGPTVTGTAVSWTQRLRHVAMRGPTSYLNPVLEPSRAGKLIITSAYSHTAPVFPANSSQVLTPNTQNYRANFTAATYVTGSFMRDYSVTIAPTDWNGNFRYCGLGEEDPNVTGGHFLAHGWLADADVTKTNMQQLTFTVRKSWGRVLQN